MNKFAKKKGFTLAELLIVVAIIGVLVAIGIPVFIGQLEKAKQSVDLSNERNAYSSAKIRWMTEDAGNEATYYFTGSAVVDSPDGITGYGKSEKDASGFSDALDADVSGTPNSDGVAQYLTVNVSEEGKVSLVWGDVAGAYYRNTILAAGTTPKNIRNENLELKRNIMSIDNEKRIKADKDILNSIAKYYESLTIEEAKSVLGDTHFNGSKRDGTQLLIYGVDNNSASVRIAFPGSNTEYLEQLGYSTTPINRPNLTDEDKNYMSQYLFSSDKMIGSSEINGATNKIKIKLELDEATGKVSNAVVWVEGSDVLKSD